MKCGRVGMIDRVRRGVAEWDMSWMVVFLEWALGGKAGGGE